MAGIFSNDFPDYGTAKNEGYTEYGSIDNHNGNIDIPLKKIVESKLTEKKEELGITTDLEVEVNDQNILLNESKEYCSALIYKQLFGTYVPIMEVPLRKAEREKGSDRSGLPHEYLPPTDASSVNINEEAIWKTVANQKI